MIDLGIGGVFISTQGASKAAYEKIYGVKKYDEAMSGIRNLMEYNRAKDEPAQIIIRFRNTKSQVRLSVRRISMKTSSLTCPKTSASTSPWISTTGAEQSSRRT